MREGTVRSAARRSWLAWLLAAQLACAAAALGAAEGSAGAQVTADREPASPRSASPVFIASRLAAGAIVVDGRLDEWQDEPTFVLAYETAPAENTPPPVATSFWIAYDSRQLYVGVRAEDGDPARIRARLRDRDRAFEDDFVGVVLDTFHDQRRAFEFFVNPLGVQMDLTYNDVTAFEDSSWDGLWASAGRITATGYEVEMAIPFTTLRFARSDGPQVWGIDALRMMPREVTRRFGLNPLPRSRNCYLCHASDLAGLAGIVPGSNLEAVPTLTATAQETPGDDGRLAGSDDAELGISGRWGITPGMTLNVALNPDFSQVEADAAQLAVNTRFALFFPEKRPFFLEGADLFDTKIGAIYTRNVADPDWGVKLTGKEGPHAFGAFVARDTRTNLLLPSSEGSAFAFLDAENTSTALRYRRDFAAAGSALGGLLTSREGADYHNRVLGLDGVFRFAGTDAVRLEVLGSQTRYPLAVRRSFGLAEELDGYALRAAYQHRTRDWRGYLEYNDASDGFRADLGFIPQVGYRRGYASAEGYRYADEGDRWWRQVSYGVDLTWTEDHGGEPLRRLVTPYVWLTGSRQVFAEVRLLIGEDGYAGQTFSKDAVDFTGDLQLTPSVGIHLDGTIGDDIDYDNARQARVVRLRPQVGLALGRQLLVELTHERQELDVAGGRLFRAGLSEVRATYQLTARAFVRAIAQYLDVRRDPAAYTFPVPVESRQLFDQLLFSYKVNPQTVLFVGYSDDHAATGSGASLETLDRTLFVKVGYAFAR